MKRTRAKRLVSLAVSLCLLLALLPVGAVAEEQPLDGSEGINLTRVAGDKTYDCGGGRASWVQETKTLTLTGNGTIKAIDSTGKTPGIYLPDYSRLEVAEGAKWSVTGSSSKNSAGHGIRAGGLLTVDIASGASLIATGGDNTSDNDAGYGLSAVPLKIKVADGGSLTAVGGNNRSHEGGYGLFGKAGIELDNAGTVIAKGGKIGSIPETQAGIRVLDPGLTVKGTGTLRCEGYAALQAMQRSEGDAGTVHIEGGMVIALGTRHGVDTKIGTLIVEEGATVVAVGPWGGVWSTVKGDGTLLQFNGTPEEGNPDAPLDLYDVKDAKAYLYNNGIVTWDPTEENAPSFTMTAFDLSTFLGNFNLSKGVKFPSDAAKTIAVTMSANTGIEGENNPAINANLGALTFFTTHSVSDTFEPAIKNGVNAKTVDFIGGNFNVNGVINAPVTLRDSAGRLEIAAIEAGGGDALPRGITITPPEGHHSELMTHTHEVGQYTHLAGSPSNGQIQYNGGESSYIAEIVEGTVAPPSGGSSSPSTYTVVYKANYENAPKDIRDSGYRAGASVTLKGAETFAAPADKVFAGWAESADGEAKYQGGETVKMPSKTLNLYAVWQDTAPGLNKTDHMAYVAGYPDGTVRPGGYITREETAMLFYRLLNEPTRARFETTAHKFPDVAASRWSNTAVATLANAGILKGRTSGHFAPGEHITRAEFAAIAARFDSDEYTGENLFPDIAGHWAADEINRAAQKGWVEGDRNGLFRPNDNITRAEAVTLLNRVLERAPETADDLLADMRTFKDNLDTGAWYYLALQEAANGHDYKRKADKIHETWTALQ